MESSPATEIVFFDVETTAPSPVGGRLRRSLLEFGAVVVCPWRLVELGNYSTPIRPSDTSLITLITDRGNGITPDSVANAPSFCDVAGNIYSILNGRVWAGHNIAGFDCHRIREAFAEIGHPPPEPKGLIDTLPLLSRRFGNRAGNMKMASLADYFDIGPQKHRSMDDVRMNLEVLKYCATVLFLESSFPDMYSGGYYGFLEPYEVSTECISVSAPQDYFYHGRRTILLHRDAPLQLCYSGLRVLRISTEFVDNVGQPKLSIVVDVPATICRILDACDHLARRSILDSGSRSEWRQLIKKNIYSDSSSVRLNIPLAGNREEGIYSTEIYHKEQSGNIQKLVFSGLDTAELDSLFVSGTVIDAYFSFEVYDYKMAGIRLVAKRLVVPV